MWLYYLLKTISTLVSWLPYKLVVNIGIGIGHLYHTIAKKQRIRAEETIKERLGYSDEEAKCTIKSLFVKLGITFMEIMYMPALNKDNIRGLVTFDRPDVLWEALNEGHGVVMLACHMDNWEWLGAALSLYGFPISAVEKPQPNRVYSDFMNELRKRMADMMVFLYRFLEKWQLHPLDRHIFPGNLKLLLYLFLLYVKKVIMGIRQSSKILFTMKIPAIGSWMTIALH